MGRLTPKKLAVIGAGTMGGGIARIARQHGFGVALFDDDPETAQRAAPRKKDTAHDRADAARVGPPPLTVAASIAAAADGADAVIEAVVESEPAKAAVLREIAGAVGPGTLLATNTSTFSIARLATAGECPGR